MNKSLIAVFFLLLAGCAHAPAGLKAAPALVLRADTYKADGRYLEALTFYRDIVMNPDWAERAGCGLYKSMADIYRTYLGDSQQAAFWQAEFQACAPGAAAAPVRDQALLPAAPLPASIRVLLAGSSAPLRLSSDGRLKIIAGGETLITAGALICEASANRLILNQSVQPDGRAEILSEPGLAVEVDGKACRSPLTLIAAEGQVLAVARVPLEEYLRGVLPREMAPSWPLEALKAQAVAARTYALYHAVLRRPADYDVLATTSSQVYDGSAKNYPSVNRAVDETRGLILSHKGKIALALFHANSGGRTESLENIWGGSLAYLCGVQDPFSTGTAGARWEKKLRAEEISDAFGQFGIAAGEVRTLEPVRRSASGRIEQLQVTAGQQTFFLSGNSFRLIVGPGKVKGTNFEVRRDNGTFVFTGSGYGHGAGMSQWGARSMAEKGSTYEDILRQYYPGVIIGKLPAE